MRICLITSGVNKYTDVWSNFIYRLCKMWSVVKYFHSGKTSFSFYRLLAIIQYGENMDFLYITNTFIKHIKGIFTIVHVLFQAALANHPLMEFSTSFLFSGRILCSTAAETKISFKYKDLPPSYYTFFKLNITTSEFFCCPKASKCMAGYILIQFYILQQ